MDGGFPAARCANGSSSRTSRRRWRTPTGWARRPRQADHHPDLLVTWGAVEVAWVNHSEGGITAKDVDMARRSDQLA